jgi:hypothetical protein
MGVEGGREIGVHLAVRLEASRPQVLHTGAPDFGDGGHVAAERGPLIIAQPESDAQGADLGLDAPHELADAAAGGVSGASAGSRSMLSRFSRSSRRCVMMRRRWFLLRRCSEPAWSWPSVAVAQRTPVVAKQVKTASHFQTSVIGVAVASFLPSVPSANPSSIVRSRL